MISAIVMAAGKGTRMQSEHAKTMHKVLDKPMVEHVCDTLDKLNVDNTVIVIGFDGESIKNHLQNRASYAIQQPQLGTAHAVMQAEILKNYTGKTLIINGDCPLISVETYQKLLSAADQYKMVVLTTVLEDAASYGRIIRDENNELLSIVEKKDCTEEQLKVNEINAGIYCVDNELLWKYLPLVNNNNKQQEYYITDLVEIFRKNGQRVGALICLDKDELQGINSRAELALASKYLQRKINNYWMSKGVSIVDPEHTYIGTDVTIEQDTIIYPNVRIEGKTTIGKDNIIEEGCYINNGVIGDNNQLLAVRLTDSKVGSGNKIGPNAHLRGNSEIGDNCRLGNYVEFKNTKFGNGSKCAHLTYLGDCTVGEKCNFGCGVVTVNYDGKNKFHTEIGNHCFIGSNANIIAPVTLADETVIAAGTTVTFDVESGEMAIGRVRQENKPEYGYKYLHK